MRDQMSARLAELEQEYTLGERRLREMDLQQLQLRETLLRIEGAMHVLREMLVDDDPTIHGSSDANGTVHLERTAARAISR